MPTKKGTVLTRQFLVCLLSELEIRFFQPHGANRIPQERDGDDVALHAQKDIFLHGEEVEEHSDDRSIGV